MEEKNVLETFEFHDVAFVGRSGDNAYGECPFCNKPKHFYVNITNGLWDCKVCQKKGNLPKFLEYLSDKYASMLKDRALIDLTTERGIDADTFKRWKIGWTGQRYAIPVREASGSMTDLRVIKLFPKKGPLMSTKGMSTGLFGAHLVKPGKGKIYICEGEWDAMALDMLARKLKKDAVVVGVPGAGTFKVHWVELFRGKEVIVLYDNDEAGENGERVVAQKLKGVAASLKFIHWDQGMEVGFDVRDWVRNGLAMGKAQGCWDGIHARLKPVVRKPTPEEKVASQALEKRKKKGPASAEEVFKTYSKWLQIDEPDAIKVLFGSCFANRLDGEPVWMFLVAPPGGMKSELLMSLKEHASIYATTSLTPHAMVSGAYSMDGKDPSLLPHLDQKMLIVKDFTTILTMHYAQRDEIFGILRDVYDGSTGKNFGTGVRREYNVKFGILAGVTNAIEAYGVMHQSLGERFLKFRASEDKRESEADKIRRALSNINREVNMREELCEVAARCLDREIESVPTIPSAMTEKLIALAQLTAMMRGFVSRDRFDKTVQYRPSFEVGTRLAKQLAKLGLGIGIYEQRDRLEESDYAIVKRVAMDTAPDRIEVIIRQLWKNCVKPTDALRTQRIADLTRLPQATVFRVLQDLELLRIVDRSGDGQKHVWRLSRKIEGLVETSGVYAGVARIASGESVAPPSKMKLRIPAKL